MESSEGRQEVVMSKWMLQGTYAEIGEECTEEGWKRLNRLKNTELFKGKHIVFVDDQGEVHDDVHNVADARKAGLLGKKKDVDKDKGGVFSVRSVRYQEDEVDAEIRKLELTLARQARLKALRFEMDKESHEEEKECPGPAISGILMKVRGDSILSIMIEDLGKREKHLTIKLTED
jgi:hypothetical protein